MKNRNELTSSSLSRRDFGKLTAAAFGGVLLGSTLISRAGENAKHDPELLLQDKHVCRGLNTCKGKAKEKDNSCAGMGSCATAEKHSCKGENACKGQGGCGEYPGQNACKGEGELRSASQEKDLENCAQGFEAQMKKAGKTFGDAPKEKP